MPVLSNAKHELFAQALAQGKTADQAYQDAGYKPSRPHASRLATNGNIVARIAEILAKGAERAEITQERVLRELGKIGFADIRKAVAWGDGLAVVDPETNEVRIANGVSLIGSEHIDDDTASAIAEVSQTKEGLKVKFHDKRSALVDIGKHLGMFKDDAAKGGLSVTVNIVGADAAIL